MNNQGFVERLPEPGDASIAQQAVQYWNSGNQTSAIDLIRPLAESDRPWAAGMMAWFLMQQGQPGTRESIRWAIRAAQLGLPGQATHVFNNAVAHTPSDPALADRLPELLEWAAPWMNGIDLVGQGISLIGQGQPDIGLKIMMLQAPIPPTTEPQWQSLLELSRGHANELVEIENAARRQQLELNDLSVRARETIETARDGLETSAKQAGLLVSTVSSDATNSLYKADAARNTKESRGVWGGGLVVLGGAASVAILPVVLHYVGLGPDYSAVEQIGLHLASTAALASFAGVLLARARSRDRAAQRANDLSTAMGTMISYSNQIADPAEKQRFMTTMGQVVLQAQLTTGSKGEKGESTSDLLTLATLIRPSLTNSQSEISRLNS